MAHKLALKAFTRRLNADLGGTEIDNALKEVITLGAGEPSEPEDAVILLITDGDVWNIEKTIATVRASGQRIYAVGVGSAPAESLLREMAEVTGGACELVTPRESMQKAVERLLWKMRKTQSIEQDITCSVPVLWQSKTARHAAPGESLTSWTQVQTEGADEVELGNLRGDTLAPCPLVWETGIELSRIAAAYRLNDLAEAKEREAIALAYQLVTSETNLILVHERAEGEKSEELPELHQVRPMLAAGYGGNGTVITECRNAPLQVLRTGCDNVPFAVESIKVSKNIASSTPAVWRTSRSQASGRVDGMSASGMEDIEIPAFLRKEADGAHIAPPQSTQTKRMAPAPANSSKVPQTSSDELVEILRRADGEANPVTELVNAFNQAALSHNHFRSALAVCLRTNTGGYLQWLVTKHMKATGLAAPIWAAFISWAAERFSVYLDRHAERLLRDFLKTVKSEIQEAVQVDLHALEVHFQKHINMG